MYIGVDLGTSGVKLLLVSQNGEIVKTVKREYDVLIPKPSWSEQNPNDWYDQTLDALKDLVMGYEEQIKGISFSGQMHGLVLLDKDDLVLRNAILWNDQRTAKQVDYLNQVIGKDKLFDYTGNIALTGLTAPKILWVKDEEPEVFQKIEKIMLPKDYLVYKLSGVFASDVSDASGTLYFDPSARRYSQEMLEILGMKEEQLPRVYESFEEVGVLRKEIAQVLGLKQEVKVIVGGGDQAVGAIGTGVVSDGECSISLGTSGVIFVASDSFNVDKKSEFQSYAHANGKYHIMAVMLNAAGALKWWNEQILQSKDYDAFFEEIQEAKKSEQLVFLPYLTGERAPINDPYAKGVLYGLEIHHGKRELDLAIIEGVSFALKESFELIKDLGVDIQKVRITGGGAKSDFWAQMLSDMLRVDVVKIASEEGPAYGAAILAMVGCKTYPSVEEACHSLVETSKEFHPKRDLASYYQKKFIFYKKLYPQLMQVAVNE